MKIIQKIIFFIFFIGINVPIVHGQQAKEMGKLALNFQTTIGITTANSPFEYALGVGFGLEMALSEELSLATSIGYHRLLTKDTSPIKDYDFLPLEALVKIFPTRTSFYALGLTGVGFGISSGSNSSFIFGGGFGYEWANSYDLYVKFEGYKLPKVSTTYQSFNGLYAIGFSYRF